MDIAALWEQIENEFSWRIDEIRFFQNQLNKLVNVKEQDKFRRALVLLLYAHYEGFCKFAFQLYVNAINKENIRCSQANYAISAAALDDLFNALRHPDSKCSEFANVLPDDKKLHVFARNKEFVQRSVQFDQRIVQIPESIVDTESNLKITVLRKNLYRLGFPHDGLQEVEGEISQLLHFRNKIAHGESKDSIDLKTFQSLQLAARNVMSKVKSYVMSALSEKLYLRV